MNKTPIQLIVCLAAVGFTLYALIEKQNTLTEMRLAIPALSQEVHAIQEENLRLEYTLDCLESPVHLLELARKPELGYLKYPTVNQVLVLHETP